MYLMVVMTDTITCSSTSTYLLVICTVNYRMNCNDNTSNPYGNIRLVATPSGGSKDTKADQGLYDINSSGATNIVRDYSVLFQLIGTQIQQIKLL